MLLQINKAKDGDMMVFKSNSPADCDAVGLFDLIKRTCGKKLAVVIIGSDEELTLLEASKARAILERLAGNKP